MKKRLFGLTAPLVMALAIFMTFLWNVTGPIPVAYAACPHNLEVLSDNPIAYWRLGDAGTAAENLGTLGAAVDATYQNGAAGTAAPLLTDTADQAAAFDGVDDFVAVPNHNAINASGDYTAKTIELWFRADGLSGRQMLYEQGGASNGFNVYLDDNTLYLGAWSLHKGWGPTYVTTTVAVDTVYHVVLVFEGNAALSGYVNNALIDSVSVPGVMHTHSGRVAIGAVDQDTYYHDGAFTGNGNYFAGTLDEVALYNAVFTPEQVNRHYAGFDPSVDSTPCAFDDYELEIMNDSPIAHWRMGETPADFPTAPNRGSLGAAADGTYTGSGGTFGVSSLVSGTNDTAFEFEGQSALVAIPAVSGLNTGGPFVEKTVELWFEARPPLSGRQILYEQGGTTRGINLYLEDDVLYFNAWNNNNDGPGSPWGQIFVTETIVPLATYHTVLVLDGDSNGTAGTLTGYLNGNSVGSTSGVGQLYNHGDPVGIGGVNGGTLYAGGSSGSSYFKGTLDEVALYNAALSPARIAAHYADFHPPSRPVGVNDDYETAEDTPLAVPAPTGVLNNDYDPLDAPLTAAGIQNQPLDGTVSLNADGSFVYTPTAEFNGLDSFTYILSNGESSSTAAVLISVTPADDPPVAVDDDYLAGEDTSLTIVAGAGVLANDIDLDGDGLTAVLHTPPQTGTLDLAVDGAFHYTPAVNFNGTVTFTYSANDGFSADTGVVTITVVSTLDAPNGNDDAYTTTEETALVIPAPGVLENDNDPDDPSGSQLAVTDYTTPTGGVLSVAENGSFVYTPSVGFVGTDQFTYTLFDGVFVNTAEVTIEVTDLAPRVAVRPISSTVAGTPITAAGSVSYAGLSPESVWDFGDGGTLTGTLNSVYTYTTPGIYTVTLTITDAGGRVGSAQTAVTVFSVPETKVYLPLIVQ